ncbi:MAG: hypothetical protein FOGNACKC_00919 [Anaerolineae bacterium]|nr:hypothetical protein [Anaerolineae bacterium]
MARISKTGMSITRRPQSPKYQAQIVRDEVRAGLVPVGAEHVRRRERITANWQAMHQPGFEAAIGVGPVEVYLRIRMANLNAPLGQYGNYTVGDLWRWLDKTGTPPHMIYPLDPRGVLRFEIGGVVLYRKWVRHPGFPPRHWSDMINAELKDDFDKAVNNAMRRGFRKALAGG